MQTIKKKKIKKDKKHKRHQIEHTSQEILDEKITKSTTISEQTFIEHKAESTKHEQTIKSVPLEIAPEKTESLEFDEKTLPMEIDTGPKPIEILPLFHASNIQAASTTESDTLIHLKDSPTQKCLVNITESTPLVISEVDKNEMVGTQESEQIVHLQKLSSTFITSSATVSDQVIPCDNVNVFESKAMPTTITAESSQILHESKTVLEQVATLKEGSLPSTYAPILKQATKSITLQSPIEVQEVDASESEKTIPDKYEPKVQSAICSVISNTALSTQETLTESVPTKFFPETFIATEEAVPKYVEQIPYQTQEIYLSETGNTLDLQEKPAGRQARLEFTNLQVATIEQTDISEREILSTHAIPTDKLAAMAKDTFDLHKEMRTAYSQPIDSVVPCEIGAFSVKKATSTLEEMDGKVIETVNVLQSEKPFDTIKTSIEQEASQSYVSQESFTILETLVQESDTKFSPTPPNLAKASRSQEVHKIAAQSDEQVLYAIGQYQQKDTNETLNAQINFELQKSVVNEAIMTNDSEQVFDVKLQSTTQPHYTTDSKLNSPIVISEVQIQDDNAQLTIEPMAQVEVTTTQEPYKAYEQQDQQVFDTTSEYRGDKKSISANAQINFELQKSTISESVLSHDLEQAFDTKLSTNKPHYSFESSLKSPILIAEVQVHEIDLEFSPKPTVLNTATSVQELCNAPESSENQTLESIDSYKQKEFPQESSAQINYELQKSMMGETVIAQDSEKLFEKSIHVIQPQYSLAPNVNSSIVVCETQTIDSEEMLSIKPRETHHLNIIESGKQLSHFGSVNETILYDSPELIFPSAKKKQAAAKQEPILHHEITVEVSNTSESLEKLEKTKLNAQKKATANIIKNIALNVRTEESSESLDKLNVMPTALGTPNLKSELIPINSIVVEEAKIFDHSTHFDIDSFKTAAANVSTTEHNLLVNIDENWSMDVPDDFKSMLILADQTGNQSIVESSAVETSTIISSDSLKEFEKQIEKPIRPKVLINEQKGIVIDDIISHEHVQSDKFTLTHELVRGQISKDVTEQRRCEQTQQNIFESIGSLQQKTVEKASATRTLSNALTVAKTEEIQTISSGKPFEEEKIGRQHIKVVQETFNVVGQSVHETTLESAGHLTTGSKTKREYPKKTIEGLSYYDTYSVALLEKEGEMLSEDLKGSNVAKTLTEQSLPVASITVDTPLVSVQTQEETLSENQHKKALPKLERIFEGINTEDRLIQEMPTKLPTQEAKASIAKSILEYKKSIQVEGIRTFEKEEKIKHEQAEIRKCEQTIEENLKSAVYEIMQAVEEIGKHPTHMTKSAKSKELANEVDQSITYESVYLQEHSDLNESAQVISFAENNPETLLKKPLVATQEKTELKSAHKENEINTIVDIKTNKKAGKITNKKVTKKTKPSATEGRWNKGIQIIFCPLQDLE